MDLKSLTFPWESLQLKILSRSLRSRWILFLLSLRKQVLNKCVTKIDEDVYYCFRAKLSANKSVCGNSCGEDIFCPVSRNIQLLNRDSLTTNQTKKKSIFLSSRLDIPYLASHIPTANVCQRQCGRLLLVIHFFLLPNTLFNLLGVKSFPFFHLPVVRPFLLLFPYYLSISLVFYSH